MIKRHHNHVKSHLRKRPLISKAKKELHRAEKDIKVALRDLGRAAKAKVRAHYRHRVEMIRMK